MARIRSFNELPDEARDFLVDVDGQDTLKQVAKAHGLPEDAVIMFRTVAEYIVTNIYALEALPQNIKTMFSVDESAAKDIAVAIAGTRLMPIQDVVVGNVADAIRSWGGDPKAFSGVPRVAVRSTRPEYHIQKLLEDAGLEIAEPVMQKRLEYILLEFAKGEHDAAKTKEILARDAKVGGLEFDEATAGRVVDLFAERLAASGESFRPADQAAGLAIPAAGLKSRPVPPASSGLALKPEGLALKPEGLALKPEGLALEAGGLAPAAPKLVLPQEPQPPQPRFQPAKDIFGEAEAKEVAAHAEKINAEIPTDIAGAVAQVVKASGLVFDSHEKRKRFESVVDSRLRDVRSAFDTRAQLEKPFEDGGLGLSGAALVKAVQAIERAYDGFQKTPAAKLAREQQAARERLGQKKKEQEDLAPRQADALAKRYTALTGRQSLEAVPASAIARQRARPSEPAPAAKIPSTVASAVGLRPEALRARPAPKPQRPSPRYSAPTIVPTQTSGKVQVRDVHFERRLAGPIEELRRMNLTDFRRLSTDPKEAALKIKDKLDLLEEESYTKKIQGVKAWRESPVNQMYVALTKEALVSGASVAEIINRKRAAKVETLTQGELDAIVALNAKLRF